MHGRTAFEGTEPGASVPFRTLSIPSPAGPVLSQYYAAPGARRAVVWVGGIVGGFDSPARSLYPELAGAFLPEGISSLRIRLRRPAWIPSGVADVRAAIAFLRQRRVQEVALVGHSIGSLVVMQAAAQEPRVVKAVVSLASLDVGRRGPEILDPTCACLFVHGRRDALLPSLFSVRLHRRAVGPKRLVLLPEAGHRLSEARTVVRRETISWIRRHLIARDEHPIPAAR